MYIDAIEVIIRMTKGDGDNMPDTSSLKAAVEQRRVQPLHSAFVNGQ